MPTPKSALRHRQIGDDNTLTVPVYPRRSRATATTQRQPRVPQEPYEAETIELVDEFEEGHEDEEVEPGQLGGSQEIHRPAPPTRQLRARITDEPITRGGRTTARVVVAQRPLVTTARNHRYVSIPLLIVWFIVTVLLLVCLNFGFVMVRNFANTEYLATTTGTTPTAQLDATLHGRQIHFVAVLLHNHLEVIALDEKDAKQTQLYPDSNPLLSDQSGPVTLSLMVRDINGDGKPDLVISATSPTVNFFWQPTVINVILLNSDGSHFKPM